MGMPVAVVLGFFMWFDFEGLWLGMLASQMSCVVAMLVVLGRTKWKLEAERAKQLMTWWIHIFWVPVVPRFHSPWELTSGYVLKFWTSSNNLDCSSLELPSLCIMCEMHLVYLKCNISAGICVGTVIATVL